MFRLRKTTVIRFSIAEVRKEGNHVAQWWSFYTTEVFSFLDHLNDWCV